LLDVHKEVAVKSSNRPLLTHFASEDISATLQTQKQWGDNNFRNGTAERTVIGQLMELVFDDMSL